MARPITLTALCVLCAGRLALPLPWRPLPPPSGPSPGSTPSSHIRHGEVQRFVWGHPEQVQERAGCEQKQGLVFAHHLCSLPLCLQVSQAQSHHNPYCPYLGLPWALPSCAPPSFDSWQDSAASIQPHSKPSYPWSPRWPSLAHPWPWSQLHSCLHCCLPRLSVPVHPLPQAKALLPMSLPADGMALSPEVSHITFLKPTQPPSWLWTPQMTALCLILTTVTCSQHPWTPPPCPRLLILPQRCLSLLFLIPAIASFHHPFSPWVLGPGLHRH